MLAPSDYYARIYVKAIYTVSEQKLILPILITPYS